MLFSVVTPSYNQGQFIKATLDSVLKQDYPHIEHIVMDGGSTDETVSILENYDDPRLTWTSEKDNGQSDAINKGMQQVSGDILAYLNSDDLYLPGTLARVAAYFAANPDVDLVYGSCYTVDAQGQRIESDPRIKVNYIVSPITLADALTMRIVLPQQGIFWRRQVTDTIGLFDESLHYRMDFDYWLRAMMAGFKFAPITDYIAAFRVHNTSKSTSQETEFWKDWYTILDKIYARDDLPQEALDLKPLAYNFASYHAADYLFRNDHRDEAKPYLRQFITSNPAPVRTKVLASAMYVDSYLGTSLSKTMRRFYRQSKGITD